MKCSQLLPDSYGRTDISILRRGRSRNGHKCAQRGRPCKDVPVRTWCPCRGRPRLGRPCRGRPRMDLCPHGDVLNGDVPVEDVLGGDIRDVLNEDVLDGDIYVHFYFCPFVFNKLARVQVVNENHNRWVHQQEPVIFPECMGGSCISCGHHILEASSVPGGQIRPVITHNITALL